MPEDTLSGDSSPEPQDWSKFRKAKPAEHLLPVAENFLDRLPREVFPSALATHYARIVNLIALHWNNRSDGAEYFNALLTDQRGGRQGFPTPVQRDLVRPRAYWELIGPQPKV